MLICLLNVVSKHTDNVMILDKSRPKVRIDQIASNSVDQVTRAQSNLMNTHSQKPLSTFD